MNDENWATAVNSGVSRSPGANAETRLLDSVAYAANVFVAVWLCWGLLGVVGVLLIPAGQGLGVPGLSADPLTPGWHNFMLAGNRADALWYQSIADNGYRPDDASAAFFPLFPLAIFLISSLPGVSSLMAASVLAQGCYFWALAVLHSLSMREFDGDVADRATRYLAVFPTAFFFLAPLTEGPFLLLSLLTFWYVRRGLWWQGALCAGLATLTRSVGMVLVVALLAEALEQQRSSRGVLIKRLAASLSPVLALGMYGGYWLILNGNPIQPLEAQTIWQREAAWPPVTAWQALETAWNHQSYWLVDLVIVSFVVAAVVVGARILPVSYVLYGAASLFLPLTASFAGRPLLSMPRYVAVIFPAFWVMAILVGRRRLPDPLVMGVFSGGFVLLGLLFMNRHAIF